MAQIDCFSEYQILRNIDVFLQTKYVINETNWLQNDSKHKVKLLDKQSCFLLT